MIVLAKINVKKRIKEHINNILNFNRNLDSSIININKKSEVAIHFNNRGHNILEHFKFIIFENNVIDKKIRRSIECDLINLFKNCKIDILNNITKQHYLFFYYIYGLLPGWRRRRTASPRCACPGRRCPRAGRPRR